MKNKTILLVDDDLNFRRALKKVLKRSGYKVATARDGQEAIDFLSENAIDVVISEVRMPELCGIELMEEIKRRRIGTPVIFLTAYGEVESYMDLMNLGAFEYLNKPVKEQEMLWTIQKAMKTQKIFVFQGESSGADGLGN